MSEIEEASKAKAWLMALVALFFFAANSVLCRMALASGDIDPASFTSIRLVSGAGMLYLMTSLIANKLPEQYDDDCSLINRPIEHWVAAAMLFLYAATFSFAYLYLDAGVGALVLFAFVQLTMFAYSYIKEGGSGGLESIGALTAICGLGYLVSPGWQAPNLWGTVLMAVAGIAWGVYSVLGKEMKVPQLKANCINFRLSLFFVVPFFLLCIPMSDVSPAGVWLAIASGAIASAIGYAIWYWVVLRFKASRAGVMQLSVPVIASVGGFLLLDEMLTQRMFISSAVILLGITLSFIGKHTTLIPEK